MNDLAERLRQRVADRSARIGIVGLGYVGLPTATAFAEEGFLVVGIEPDERRRDGVNAGRSHVEDVPDATVRSLVRSGRLQAVGCLADAGQLDVVDICVPTPLDKSRDPDVSAIRGVIDELPAVLARGQLIVLTSTTYPGTTAELLQPGLEAAGMWVGEDVFVAFAPERIDPGNTTFNMRNTPKVVGGATPTCLAGGAAVFATIADRVVPVSSPAAAEMAKLLENTFRSVNIALANEVAIMCHQLGIDVGEVIDAAATKPYGFMPFYPGPGLGGHCIPVDPTYLSWKLRRLNYTARFISVAEDINRHMPEYVVQRAADVLNDEARSLRGSTILLLGVSYKAEVGDLREFPRSTSSPFSGTGAPTCTSATRTSTSRSRSTGSPFAPATDRGAAAGERPGAGDHGAPRLRPGVVQQHARAVLDTRGWWRSGPNGTAGEPRPVSAAVGASVEASPTGAGGRRWHRL